MKQTKENCCALTSCDFCEDPIHPGEFFWKDKDWFIMCSYCREKIDKGGAVTLGRDDEYVETDIDDLKGNSYA